MVNSLNKAPVAIIGMASIFPQAKNLQDYWDNIYNKIDCITDVPFDRWNPAEYFDPDPDAQDKTYCKRGGFIPDIDFDPAEFGLPPNILEVTDVSQLLSLVVARDALEDAGYGEKNPKYRETTGVILGFGGTSTKLFTPLVTRLQYPVWEKAIKASGISDADTQKIIAKIKSAYVNWEENAFPGILGNVVAGRIANRFDLGGTNCVVDAACASSLAALRMAVGELVEGNADLMITGGVDTDNSINTFMCFSKTPAFSKSQYPRPFDAESDGMMSGEGLGMLILKRLVDAEKDGDRIYAVIRGIGTSSDGRFKSIYAPRPAGQSIALKRAYAMAGFEPNSVGLIEAHGTGTVAGDPAEFQGLKDVFVDPDLKTKGPHIALGSVKSQIAHTKATAGAASLIKVSLALYQKILPATIHVTMPNPKLGIDETPFYVNIETRPWFQPADGSPRRAGVSAFGFGGTNFHVVLEEYQKEPAAAFRLHRTPYSILIAAPDPIQLAARVKKTMADLTSPAGNQAFLNLVNDSNHLIPIRNESRVGFNAIDRDETAALLKIGLETLQASPTDESWENPKGLYYRKSGMGTDGKVVAMFSGQGSQYVNMGRELALNFPEIRQSFQAMDSLFAQDHKNPLSTVIYPRPVFSQADRENQEKDLQNTEHAQPAIGVFGSSLFKLLANAGFKADYTAGHSFGELTALWAAGVISESSYYDLAKARGKAMAPPSDPDFDAGAMLAVKGSGEQVRDLIKNFPDITLANWNSNTQVVLAGPKPAINQVQKHLAAQGLSVVLLPVSAAFHTPLVGHAQKPFAAVIGSQKFQKPAIPVFSNTTGKQYPVKPEAIQATLANHILNPVLFRDEIESIYAEGGRIFVEFGPKAVITGLVKSTLGDRPHLAVALNSNPKKDSDWQLRDAVMLLRVAGLPMRHFDPHPGNIKISQKKKSGINMTLSGSLYVSEKTRLAHEKAMNDGFKVAASPVTSEGPTTQPATALQEPSNQAILTSRTPIKSEVPLSIKNNGPVLLDNILGAFIAQQSSVARAHEQYMANENEYTRTFSQLTLQEAGLITQSAASPQVLAEIGAILQTINQSLLLFQQHQDETLRVHETYLNNQLGLSQAVASLLQGNTVDLNLPVRPAPAAQISENKPAPRPEPIFPPSQKTNSPQPAQPARVGVPNIQPAKEITSALLPVKTTGATGALGASPSISSETISKTLLEVVSEKTGYPVEMLEPAMDMEADLGIDSIKRVEILGAMQERFPSLPKIDPEALAELRTLGQIIDHMGQGVPSVPLNEATDGTQPVEQTIQPIHSESAISLETISKVLLDVVSEKTGYPVEMLEPAMDMEADLGIDSIKRVEILGAMQERFPSLPKIDPEALAELRTLGQIIEHMAKGVPTVPLSKTTDGVQPVEQTIEPIHSESAVSLETISRALREVVSEKTGYPVEMLEPGMDMEADLGIDSIKRVEILGAMQERFLALPKIDPEALAELRTLGQIVDHLGQTKKSPPQESVQTLAAPVVSLPELQTSLPNSLPDQGSDLIAAEELIDFSDSTIQRGLVSLKSLPKPDFLDFNLQENSVCLITDDGSQTTSELAQALINKGWKTAVLSFPEPYVSSQSTLPESALSFKLDGIKEDDLVKVLKEINTACGPVSIFIHLSPSSKKTPGRSNGKMFSQSEKAIIKLVFLIAKHLKEDLNRVAINGRSAFMAVTRLDGEFGIGLTGVDHPTSGGLFGLVKTLNLEWEPVFCRAIDLDPEMKAEPSVQVILSELHDPNRLITEVGYNSQGRTTLVITR